MSRVRYACICVKAAKPGMIAKNAAREGRSGAETGAKHLPVLAVARVLVDGSRAEAFCAYECECECEGVCVGRSRRRGQHARVVARGEWNGGGIVGGR